MGVITPEVSAIGLGAIQPEIRERTDGRWTFHYPDPGFLPCNCSKECVRTTEAGPKMIEAHSSLMTLAEAIDFSKGCYPNKEPKVIGLMSRGERTQRYWNDRREQQEEQQELKERKRRKPLTRR